MRKRAHLRCFSLLVVFSVNLHAQDIYVNLSLKDTPTNAVDSLAPYLKISYVNSGDRDYYFPALMPLDSDRPSFGTAIHLNFGEKIPTKEQLINQGKQSLYVMKEYKGDHYYIPIDFLYIKDTIWELILEADFGKRTYYQSFINYDLFQYSRRYPDARGVHEKSQLACPDTLRNDQSFVFLKAGESVSQFIGLRDLADAEIIITFCLKSDRAPESVDVPYGEKLDLPSKVHGYELYRGQIESNTLTVDFSSRTATPVAQTTLRYEYDAAGNRIYKFEETQIPVDSVVVSSQKKKISPAKSNQPAISKRKGKRGEPHTSIYARMNMRRARLSLLWSYLKYHPMGNMFLQCGPKRSKA